MNNCELIYSLVDKKSGTFSSNSLVGKFSFDAKDEEITKSFTDSQSEIKIWVGVRVYGNIIKKTPKQIEVAIAFGNIDPESTELFRYADSAIASTVYDKKSKFISVSKTIQTNNEVYRFLFGCSRDK